MVGYMLLNSTHCSIRSSSAIGVRDMDTRQLYVQRQQGVGNVQASMKLGNATLKTLNHGAYIIMASTRHGIDNACTNRMNSNGLKH